MVSIRFGKSLIDLLQGFPLAFLLNITIAASLELDRVSESLNTPRTRDPSKEGTNASHRVEPRTQWRNGSAKGKKAQRRTSEAFRPTPARSYVHGYLCKERHSDELLISYSASLSPIGYSQH